MWAALAVEQGVQGVMALVVAAQRLGSCGAQAELFHDMWHLCTQIRDRTHVSCTGRQILTTEPSRKPWNLDLKSGSMTPRILFSTSLAHAGFPST